MRIIKKINNNVALAKDGTGKDVVVFGRGIGFPAMPYELTDLSKIQRTFYEVKDSYVELSASLPEDMVMLAADIVELAQCELDCELNPALPFTLADHLNFAVERFQNGMVLNTPMAYDVEHFYPVEAALGRRALEIIRQSMGISLPACEAVNIALHLVNGEMESSDMPATLAATKVIRDVTEIIETSLDIQLDTAGFNYSRFVMHLRYLIQRMQQGAQESTGMGAAMWPIRLQYPEIFRCTQKIADYLLQSCGWQCSQDEMLYLFMHINRLESRNHS